MKIYACSDLHVSPEHFSDRAKLFLSEAAERADRTLFCGDILEGSWFTLKESIESKNGQDLLSLVKAQKEPVLIRGNHDWTLQKHLEDHKVFTYYEFEADGVKYYATHGWAEYDMLFGCLAPIYDRILPILSILARLWTRWKTPGALLRRKRTLLYWRCVREMANQALFHCIKESGDAALRDINARRVPIWGHSHHRHIDEYDRWLAINCGDFVQDHVGGIIIKDGHPMQWNGC